MSDTGLWLLVVVGVVAVVLSWLGGRWRWPSLLRVLLFVIGVFVLIAAVMRLDADVYVWEFLRLVGVAFERFGVALQEVSRTGQASMA